MLFPLEGSRGRARTVAAVEAASAILINSTFDGLNLFAKEAAYLAEGTPILLSDGTGAYEHLSERVEKVDPFDIQLTASQIANAAAGAVPVHPAVGREYANMLAAESAVEWLMRMRRDVLGG